MQVLYLGRAPRTKETLPDFLKWSRVTRRPLVFRGLTGSQRTPRFWGVTELNELSECMFYKMFCFSGKHLKTVKLSFTIIFQKPCLLTLKFLKLYVLACF